MNAALESLHPIARPYFEALSDDLGAAGLPFRPYEGHRSPQQQLEALASKASKVGPWRSVHQYGFACDFVPYIGDTWVWWAAEDPRWDELARRGAGLGIIAPIKWDRPHLVIAGWRGKLGKWLGHTNFT